MEEALLRTPPDDPASLVHTALISNGVASSQPLAFAAGSKSYTGRPRRSASSEIYLAKDAFASHASSLPLPSHLRPTTIIISQLTPTPAVSSLSMVVTTVHL